MDPKYQAVADTLRREIATGVYRDGQALLTEAELKTRFRVSRQTVRQAISQLESDGLVIRRRGSGTYVSHGPRKHGTVQSVGVITTYITDYIFPSIVRGIESVLSAQSCLMTLSATYNSVERERALLTRLLETPVDGLIIEGTKTALPNPNTALYEKLWERNIPYVFINGYYPHLTPCTYVVTDDEAGGYQAVETLLAKGIRRIGGVFKSDDMQGRLRHRGFSRALASQNLHSPGGSVCWFTTESKPSFLRDPAGAAFLQGLRDRVEAVVCYNDDMALQLLQLLPSYGLRVPEELSLISFDNSPYASVCAPRLTSLSHPKEAFGRVAAEKLLRMMQGQREESLTMPWDLVERESLRP